MATTDLITVRTGTQRLHIPHAVLREIVSRMLPDMLTKPFDELSPDEQTAKLALKIPARAILGMVTYVIERQDVAGRFPRPPELTGESDVLLTCVDYFVALMLGLSTEHEWEARTHEDATGTTLVSIRPAEAGLDEGGVVEADTGQPVTEQAGAHAPAEPRSTH